MSNYYQFKLIPRFILSLFLLSLTVTGCGGGSNRTSESENHAPVAEAGEDMLVSRNNLVTLNGSDCSDADGDTLTFTWSQVAGPDVTGGNGKLTGETPAFTAPAEPDTIVFELVVNDGQENSTSDHVTITILENANAALFVDADNGSDQTGNGSQLKPFASITKALCEVTHNQEDIYVITPAGNTVYDETTDPCPGAPARHINQILAIPTGTSLYGGYDANWKRDVANNPTPVTTLHHGILFTSVDLDAWFSGFNVQANNSPDAGTSVYALSALGGSAKIYIRDNQLKAGNVGAGIAVNPGTSYGLRVGLIAAATIKRNVIAAGSGGNGKDVDNIFDERAEDGYPGHTPTSISTDSGEGGVGGVSDSRTIYTGGRGGSARAVSDKFCNKCDGVDGGKGAGGDKGGAGGEGGTGTGGWGYPGVAGTGGTIGQAGIHGVSGSGAGRLLALTDNGGLNVSFQPGFGEKGHPGEAGGGGGGGGGGQASINIIPNFQLEWESAKGGGGGGGGGGGAGGSGGPGGSGGGASIGLLVTLINNVSIKDNEISSQSSGNGGAGNQGQLGGNGGPAGVGADPICLFNFANQFCGGKGGDGGTGANGGTGGHGAAGGGGPSYGLAIGVNTAPTITNNVIASGDAGEGGIGGGGNDGEGGNSYAVYYDGIRDDLTPLTDTNTLAFGSEGPGGNAGNVGVGGNDENIVISIPDPQPEPIFRVSLPCKMDIINRDTDCEPELIEIPDGRPVYALLVSGFHQNRDLDMFHYYNFARCLIEKGAYVHFAWWNNLLVPYMERPLHNAASVPSYQGSPIHDIIGFTLGVQPTGFCNPFPDKALPADDYQFQADAKALLEAIHQRNPDATIILVGHSMGGNTIVRLAQEGNIDNIDIALLAPIDPVGNRTCVENYPGAGMHALTSTCNGAFNFTRWRAIRSDVMGNSILDWALFNPPKRPLGTNVKYLYHRWQQEFMPPFDYTCPEDGNSYWPCGSWYPEEDNYLFNHSGTVVAEAKNFPEFNNDPENVQLQSKVETDLFSGQDVPVFLGNFAGGLDGHGEIVGFRGTLFGGVFYSFNEWFEYIEANPARLGEFESYPLALKAEGNWPSYQNEKCTRYDPDLVCRRVELMKAWDKQKNYLDDLDHAPLKPTNVTEYPKCVDAMSDGCTFCMVSEDLCTILDKI